MGYRDNVHADTSHNAPSLQSYITAATPMATTPSNTPTTSPLTRSAPDLALVAAAVAAPEVDAEVEEALVLVPVIELDPLAVELLPLVELTPVALTAAAPVPGRVYNILVQVAPDATV